MSKIRCFIFTEDDLLKTGVLDADKCVDTCEKVFGILSDGDYLMGGLNHNEHGLSIVFPKETPFPKMPVAGPERRFIAMPAYLGGEFGICGEKWYGSNVKNPKERGLPRSVLMITLNDTETCEPIAYMSGNLISSMRTGCIPGVFLRYFGNKHAETAGDTGVGPVQRATILALHSVMPDVKKVYCKSAAHRPCKGICCMGNDGNRNDGGSSGINGGLHIGSRYCEHSGVAKRTAFYKE